MSIADKKMRHKVISLRMTWEDSDLLKVKTEETGKSINQLILEAIRATYGINTRGNTNNDIEHQITQMQLNNQEMQLAIQEILSRLAVVEQHQLDTRYQVNTNNDTNTKSDTNDDISTITHTENGISTKDHTKDDIPIQDNELQDNSSSIESQNTAKSYLLTASELAQLLGVTDRTVSNVAIKGNEYFREWSRKFSNGTWDFEEINPSSKKPRRQFYRVDKVT